MQAAVSASPKDNTLLSARMLGPLHPSRIRRCADPAWSGYEGANP